MILCPQVLQKKIQREEKAAVAVEREEEVAEVGVEERVAEVGVEEGVAEVGEEGRKGKEVGLRMKTQSASISSTNESTHPTAPITVHPWAPTIPSMSTAFTHA